MQLQKSKQCINCKEYCYDKLKQSDQDNTFLILEILYIDRQMSTQRGYNRSQDLEDLRRKNQLIEQQLQIKNQKIDDLNFQLRNIKKQQSIWQHLGRNNNKSDMQKQNERIVEENKSLVRQISSLLAENEHKDRTIEQLKQKISDIRYHNEQLKRISKKSEQIYLRQIQILKTGTSERQSQEFSRLKQQKQKLQTKMNKCAQIVKQTEQFYVNQINQLSLHQKQQKNVIERLQYQLHQKQELLLEAQNQINILKQSLSENKQNFNCKKWNQESDIEELITRQNIQKRWELALSQMKDRYQREINQLKDNIKFLILKLEAAQDISYQHNKRSSFDNQYNQTNIFGSSSSSLLAQSKIMVNSTQSNQSFRFTPNNSFSSSIKQSLNRRESGALRTPSKQSCGRHSNSNTGFLLDRTNI